VVTVMPGRVLARGQELELTRGQVLVLGQAVVEGVVLGPVFTLVVFP
jgi:hypothetical protein